MRTVLPKLRHLDRLRVANVFLVDEGPGRRWLVDTGHAVERRALLRELDGAGIGRGDLAGVLLTHRHSDHAGNAAFLQETFAAPILAHRADALVLSGAAPRPRLERGGGERLAGWFASIENRFPARVEIDRALDDGDEVGGLEVHWTPGHTGGSVCLRHAATLTLFSGDALLAAHPPLTIRQGLALPHPVFASDYAQALSSLRAFHARDLPYRNLLAGHGRPMLGSEGEIARRVIALLDGAEPLAEERGVKSPAS